MKEKLALDALAQALAEKVKRGKQAKPRLRVVETAKPTVYDSITRDSVLRRIRFLSRAYNLHWLVDQSTFNVANLDCLDDHQIGALLRDMERARECAAEGITFEDAGLLRSVSDDIPEWS